MSREQTNKIETSKESSIPEMGEEILAREAEANIEPRRKHGYMMATALAMFLAFGAAEAKGQVRGVGPQKWGGVGRDVLSTVINQGSFGARSAIDRNEAKKRESIEQEYISQLSVLQTAEKEMERQWAEKKAAIKGNSEKLAEMEAQHASEKREFTIARTKLRAEYEKKMNRAKVKKELIDAVFSGATRGW